MFMSEDVELMAHVFLDKVFREMPEVLNNEKLNSFPRRSDYATHLYVVFKEYVGFWQDVLDESRTEDE